MYRFSYCAIHIYSIIVLVRAVLYNRTFEHARSNSGGLALLRRKCSFAHNLIVWTSRNTKFVSRTKKRRLGGGKVRARFGCLTKPCDIMHMTVFFQQNISQMVLSGVYTVCLKLSLLSETKIFYTKLDTKLKNIYILIICLMNTMDSNGYYTSTLMAV